MALELRDWTAYGNDLTGTNSPTEQADAPAGLSGATKCIQLLDASTQFVTAVDSASLSIAGDHTFEFWMKTDETGGSFGFHKGGSVPDLGLSWYGDSAETIQGILSSDGTYPSGNGGEVHSGTGKVIVNGTWHHYAISYNAATQAAAAYVDAVSVGSMTNTTGTLPSSIYDTAEPLKIYCAGTTGTYVKLADFRFWDDVRSSAEISANYGARLTGDEANLVAYYPFEDIGYPSRGGYFYMST